MILFALELMLSATMLMLLVLAVRKPVAQLFGAEWAYALWALPVILPMLPDLPALSASHAFTLLLPVDAAPAAAGAAGAAGEAAANSGQWLLLLLALWGGGAAFFALWQQSTYSAFILHLGPQGRTAVPPSFGGIKVVESDAVEGPVALGIFRRRIVVPLDFATRYSADEQRLALEHELVHHRRLDLVWNWVALGILTLNWFNPVAHFAFRAFRADQELACDAAVTRRAPGKRHDYACALVKSASQPGLIAVCPLNHAQFLKRRLKMMKQHRASWARTIGGAASVALVGVVGLAVATPGFAQQERDRGEVVASEDGREPFISKAEIARLREKCGTGEYGQDSIECSDEEARDPEVRAIMDRTKKRVDAHVEKVIKGARIEEKVAKAMASVKRAEVERSAARAQEVNVRLRESLTRLESPEHQARVRESLRRAQEQLARLDLRAEEAEIHRALRLAHRQIAVIDVDAITRNALRSLPSSARIVSIGFSPQEKAELERDLAELRREVDEARREALQDAAEARREAFEEAAEARREQLQEAADARREAAQAVREARREHERAMRLHRREMRHAPPPPILHPAPLVLPMHAPAPPPPLPTT